jgi:DNA-binding IclR family transcriptional regulator
MPRKALTPSLPEQRATPGGVAAVDKALALLAAFADDETSVSLSQLAQRTGLYKSALLRLLASLEQAALMQRLPPQRGNRESRWRIGPAAVRLNRLYQAAAPTSLLIDQTLHALVGATGESAAFHVVHGRGAHARRLCLQRLDSPQAVRHIVQVGDILPLERGTGGRVLSAFTPELFAQASPADQAVLAKVRAQGWAASVGDHLPDVAGISAPVFGPGGAELVGALTLTMPSQRYREGLISAVAEAAQQLSLRLNV